jgi:hypothetical protein
MKNIIIALMLFTFVSAAFAQNNKGKIDDMGRIALNAYLPEDSKVPSSARSVLENKLTQIATTSGMGGSALNPRFIITANVVELTKDITATAPPMQAYTLDVTLVVGDGIEGKKYASYTATVKGVGENEAKAYLAALKNVNPNDPKIKSFVESAKTRIVEYYNTNCDFIIKDAQTTAAQKQYDWAIYKLTSVPEVCKECYDKCMDAAAAMYKQKIEFDCKTKLTEATNIWNGNQSWEGAERAGEILSSIDPDASCYKEAKGLSEKISKRILEVDKREWNMKVEKEIGLERDMIKAYRDVGVAYGNGQPKSMVYNVRGWF